MTFTSTHQQIFIKFSIFCIFFSNSEVCTDTTICWLVLEPLYPVLESCDMKSGSPPPPHRTSLVTNGPKELLELKPILHSVYHSMLFVWHCSTFYIFLRWIKNTFFLVHKTPNCFSFLLHFTNVFGMKNEICNCFNGLKVTVSRAFKKYLMNRTHL